MLSILWNSTKNISLIDTLAIVICARTYYSSLFRRFPSSKTIYSNSIAISHRNRNPYGVPDAIVMRLENVG